MKSNGIGFFGVLQIVFIVLKICGFVKWSWVWVFIPFYIDVVLLIIAAFIAVKMNMK